MKKLIYILAFLLLTNEISFAQPEIGFAEVLIRNNSGRNSRITVKVYPVGAIFSGYYDSQSLEFKYSLKRSNQGFIPHWPENPVDTLRYIVGGIKTIAFHDFGLLDFDDGLYFHHYSDPSQNEKVIGGISYGLWKLEFYVINEQDEIGDLLEECFIDYRDVDFNVYHGPDLILNLLRKDGCSTDSLVFNFVADNGDTVNIRDAGLVTNKTIKMWERVGTNHPTPYEGSPNKGLFKSASLYSNYPIDATQYGAVAHSNPGLMSLNLEIQNNDTAKINSGIPLIVDDSTMLILKNSSSQTSNARLYVQNNGELRFKNAAALIIKNYGSVVSAVVGVALPPTTDHTAM